MKTQTGTTHEVTNGEQPMGKWVRTTNGYYRKRWDESTVKAVERHIKEVEERREQAAWVARCVKTKFAPFPVIPDIIVANGRAWIKGAAPAWLEFGLEELVSYFISQMLYHGKNSEQHQDAQIALRILLRK